MSALTVVLFVLGFALLVGGAELLVRGASRLAIALGVAPLVVGLTVVAFGTSAPELAVTVRSAGGGESELAIGNVFGSNIANVLLILGISAAMRPLTVSSELIRRDVPVMIGASALVLGLVVDGSLARADGVVLLTVAVGYSVWLARTAQGERSQDYEAELADEAAAPGPLWRNLGLMAGGVVLLVVGAEWLVDGAVEVAARLGWSELVIGLTVVAIGTSLPELATSVVSTLRDERDIVAGNVVGSNLYNLLLVLGLGAVVAPDGIPAPDSAVGFDGPIMLVAAVVCLPVFFNGGVIRRWEGVVFTGYYATYVTYLVLDASGHGFRDPLGTAVGLFVLPLTLLTLVVVTVRELRRRRDGHRPDPVP